MRVAYLSPRFPKVRHGFQLEELRCLAPELDLLVVSLRQPSAAEFQWLRDSWFAAGHPQIIVPNRGLAALQLGWTVPGSWAAGILAETCLTDLRGGTKIVLGIALARALEREVRAFGPDIVHADFMSSPATVGLELAARLSVPFTMNAHAFDVFSSVPAGRATRLLLAEKMRRSAGVFAENSEAVRVLEEIAAEWNVEASVRLKRNGISIPESSLSVTPSQATVVGCFGALVPKKGFDIVLRALALLGPQMTVHFHGDGPERRSLSELAVKLGVDAKFFGVYSRVRLPELLEEVDLVAIGSRVMGSGDSDGMPTVLLEAMSLGRPVVATDVGAVRDGVVDGRTGFVVPEESPDEMARAIGRLQDDPELRRAMGQAGRRLVAEEFSVGRSSAVLLSAWRDLEGDASSNGC